MSAPNLITDLAIRQLPSSPLFSGLLGLNAIAIDPNFGTQIMRLTDGSSGSGNFDSMQSDDDPSGYAMWNTDDTMILARSTGGNAFVFQFNPSTMQGTQLGTAFPYKLSGANTFSKVSNGILYNCPQGGTVVNQLNFALIDGVWTYQNTVEVCDFADILPEGFNVTWQSELEISAGDAIFTIAFSQTGDQNTGFNLCLYKPGSGFRMINTQTLAVTGAWGEIGIATLLNTPATNFFLHGVNQPPNPAYTNLGPVALDDTFIWANETLTITSTGLGGHHGIGWENLYTGNPGGGQYDAVPFSNPSTHSEIIPKQAGPPGLPQYQTPPQVYTGDQHSAMGPLNTLDETILWITNGAPPIFPFTSCWMGEVRGIDVTGAISGAQGTVYRLCQTYNSGKSPQYIVTNSLCSPSQTGKYAAFGSDMGGAGTVGPLGSTSGGATGVIGGNARGDLFIAAIFSRGSVGPAIGTTTTSLVSSGTPANQGANVTFSASIATTGASAPTGIVTFYANPVSEELQYVLGSGNVVAGIASITISTLALGSVNITADYSGDAYNYPSVSAGFVETIIAVVTTTPTAPSSDPFDLLLNNTASVMTRVASSAGGYGGTSSFSTAASGVACRVSILAVGTDKEFLAKSKENIAYRKVLLRPWFLDPSPDGSYVPNWVYQGTSYNTEPLTHDHWFQIRGDMYDIFELRNPGEMDHHLEAWCRITLP